MIEFLTKLFSVLGIILGFLAVIALYGYILSLILDKVRTTFKMMKYLLEYMYYRKLFIKWFEENKDKNINSL